MRLVSVERFTEPADQAGRRVSRVTFSARAEYDDWTKTPPMPVAVRDEVSHTDLVTQTFPMVLTNEGWTVATDLPIQ